MILAIIKVSRPGFWPTHLWFFLLPFSGRDVLGSMPFWLGCIYVCFPLGLLLYGWNDIGDTETDRLNPRKDSWLFGARPNQDTRNRLPLLIAVVQAPFVIAFVSLSGWKMLLWFALVLVFNASYNFGCKKLPVLDLINQVGYLLIFVLASWLCNIPQLNLPAMIFCALFAMQSHLFGQLMDIVEDCNAGRRSTAIALGALQAKYLLVAIMLAESLIAFAFFRSSLVGWFMTLGTVFFCADAAFGPRHYPLSFVKGFFLGWNIVVLVTMHLVWRYGLFMLE